MQFLSKNMSRDQDANKNLNSIDYIFLNFHSYNISQTQRFFMYLIYMISKEI